VPLKTPDDKLNVSRVAFHPDKAVNVAIVRIDDLASQHFLTAGILQSSIGVTYAVGWHFNDATACSQPATVSCA
jgi:hypothetical protein